MTPSTKHVALKRCTRTCHQQIFVSGRTQHPKSRILSTSFQRNTRRVAYFQPHSNFKANAYNTKLWHEHLSRQSGVLTLLAPNFLGLVKKKAHACSSQALFCPSSFGHARISANPLLCLHFTIARISCFALLALVKILLD